ncbi:Werner syndrome ATP-dependent helicase-like protein [Lachnellula hyalina]|uniref:Werner syndrome ATP-dependent helicase-like protein n=1 Tax=Lachnellula hyalina TaxID=1316788 RepID=A0A8H8R665_9HELO|nr:Werner syndrome ATP-dependent helicase-like protein [Lachnellula hyalina]TVY27574.1 Werner syndrome ATP-dependent helicase-like protein [Lachnellula hyalina]
MLLCHHGASTLGKTLRPIVYRMSGESALRNPFMTSGERSTRASMATSSPKVPTSGRPKPPQPKTWHPSHGIRFSPGPDTPRMNTTAAVEIEQDLMLHSKIEENYILGPLQTTSRALPEEKTETPTTYPPLPADLPPQDPKYNFIPTSTSEWKPTEELFRAAKNAPLGAPESYWSHSLYRHTTTPTQKVTVHYCKSLHTTERVLQTYFLNEPLIGFDIEWLIAAHRNSGPKQNVSLIQIASSSRIALFHIALYPGTSLVSPTLKRILEDDTITKVGVSIKSDCTRLRTHLDIHPRGLFELSHLYKLVKYSPLSSRDLASKKLINKKLVSLATQVQEHLHLPMYKGDVVRSSDWSRALNLEQIRYAASDSYAGVQLFDTLECKRRALEPTPPRPWHAELNLPIRVAEGLEIETDGEGEEEEEIEKPVVAKRKYTRTAVPDPVKVKNADADEDVKDGGRDETR